MMAREITLTEFIDRFENGDIRILDVVARKGIAKFRELKQ